MSALEPDTAEVAGQRVLVLGRAPEVLKTVLAELGELGVVAEGSAEPDQAAERFHAGDFDLVAFGGGVPAKTVERLRWRFARQNRRVRFLQTGAPRVAREIAAKGPLAGAV